MSVNTNGLVGRSLPHSADLVTVTAGRPSHAAVEHLAATGCASGDNLFRFRHNCINADDSLAWTECDERIREGTRVTEPHPSCMLALSVPRRESKELVEDKNAAWAQAIPKASRMKAVTSSVSASRWTNATLPR